MATIPSVALTSTSSSSIASTSNGRRIYASLHLPSSLRVKKGFPSLKLPRRIDMSELLLRETTTIKVSKPELQSSDVDTSKPELQSSDVDTSKPELQSSDVDTSKLYAVLEAVYDRAEMHAIIGAQRNNWNRLFTDSINSIALAATLMAGVSSIPMAAAEAFKLPGVVLFAAATGIMTIVNKIQPSQLAEEQRNATRLWKQLGRSIETTLALHDPTETDVEEAMVKVFALDKAYPLPLLPGMLEKFPKIVEPTRWWPKKPSNHGKNLVNRDQSGGANGWSEELEEEMRGALRVIKLKDEHEYVSFGKLLLRINKALAISGPVLAGVAAVATAQIGAQPALGPLPVLAAVVCGSLATAANTFEHAAQVGMVFEICRKCAGFHRQLQEEIEWNLKEEDVEKRENGELFEMKMALQLGRSFAELKELAAYTESSCKDDEDVKEFAGKLL